VRRVDLPTGVAIIAVATDGQNQIVVAPGANAQVSTDDVTLSRLSPGAGVLLASLEVPIDTVVAAVASARRLGLTPIVNPAPARALPGELLAHRPILTPNQDELLSIAGSDDLEAALATLSAAGSGPVVVTRGAVGALLADGTQRIGFPADQVRVVDATGAGDTFSGVLAAWLADGRPLPAAVAAATVAAGLSVGQPGARGGMPRRAAIEAELG
jgi:ribokinase